MLHSLTLSQTKGQSRGGSPKVNQHICFSLSSWANEEKLLLPEKRR